MKALAKKFLIVSLGFAALCLVFACAQGKSAPAGSIKPEMWDAYQTTSELYSLVWSPASFKDKRNEKRILELIDRLSDDFHRVGKKSSPDNMEPGFKVTLLSQQEMISDIGRRFRMGYKDYANERLRGLSANCVSCHSRFEDKNNFLGLPTPISDTSFEGRLASAEFLIASRQFEPASAALRSLAWELSSSPDSSFEALRALKLWLLVQVRVRNRDRQTASELSGLLENSKFPREERAVIRTWISDLSRLKAQENEQASSRVSKADSYIQPVLRADLIREQEASLVPTLEATELLHEVLQEDISAKLRRRSTCLLAQAYNRLPIQTFDIFSELYLERCIREFPNTKEAREAFEKYERRVKTLNTGSGGLHLENEDIEKLNELRSLAFR